MKILSHLSGMDAMFLHVESPEMPMHVGSLHVLDLQPEHEGDFFEKVRAHLAGRLHLARVFSRKLAQIPFDLSNPVWVEDEDVDLDHHIRHITLPKPGSNAQLQQTVARLHSNLLDRSRPLWEMVVIDGLRSGRVGLYIKVHHAAIDGQAGVALGRAVFDVTPTGRQIKPPRARQRHNRYQLGMAELVGAAAGNAVQQTIKVVRVVPEMARAAAGLWRTARAAGTGGLSLRKITQMFAPRTPLNVSITNQRGFAARTVPVAEVKLVAQRLGVSFNDVVLATTSGALRQFLLDQDALPAKTLTAAVPMSLRQAGDETANNQATITLMDLATQEPDRLSRVKAISACATRRKAAMSGMKSAIPMDFPVFAAPWLVSGLASIYGRSHLADMLPPLANVIVSNVAGIPVPLYVAGAKIACYYPVSIPAHGMALNVTVQSYDGRLDYGLIACRRALPDLNELGDLLLEEHRALVALAEAQQPAAAPSGAKGRLALKVAGPAPRAAATTKAAPSKAPQPAPRRIAKRATAARAA
jgi:WS/DGAT/MGAT family acyltransferase